ncbi:hypothetical protein LOD99_7627 [Oopsacas minuta]|uniref:Uncharacterized protein n=1 Tax=Oopsacas minuta TaxID=111878 RepID=A0AAV7JP06_9METZ|nr:hypothetical protein LOD99_7627 [Oopsacas minuta]
MATYSSRHPIERNLKLTPFALAIVKAQINQCMQYSVDAIFNVSEGKIYEVNSIVRDSVEREGFSGGTNKEKLTSMDLGLSKVFTKSSRKTTLTSCTCLFPPSWGLPYRHMLIVYHHEKITNFHDKAIVDFWKIENQADHSPNINSCIGSHNVIELQENDQNNPILTKDERYNILTTEF